MGGPAPGQEAMLRFWTPRLSCAAMPGLSLSPRLSLCRKLYPKPEIPENSLWGLGGGWRRPPIEYGGNPWVKTCLASPNLGSLVSFFALKPPWPSLGFSQALFPA